MTFLFSSISAVVAFGLNLAVVPESRDEKETPVDWIGGALVTVGLFGLVYAIMEYPTYGVTEPAILVALVGGCASLALFVWWQLRTPNPMLDVRLFRVPELGLSALAIILVFFAMMGAFFGMSQMLQLVMDYSPLAASFAMIPMMLPMLFLAPIVPTIVERVGTKWTVVPGLLIVAGGLVLMSLWPVDLAYWQVLGGVLVMSAGMALTMTPATNLMMSSVPVNRSGMGSALNDTTRELGGALGIAVLGSMLSSRYTDNISDAVAGLPQEAAAFASASLGGALEVAAQVGEAGQALAYAAKQAFMDGMSAAMIVGSVIASIAAALFVFGMRNREHNPEQTPKRADTSGGP